MSILDSAIALDKKRAAGRRSESARVLSEMEAAIRAEVQDELEHEIAARKAAEARATAAEAVLAGAQAAATRSGIEAEGLRRENERLNASLERMHSMHKEMMAEPKTSVTDAPPPPAPVAYSMDVKRGSDGLIKSVQVTPKGI